MWCVWTRNVLDCVEFLANTRKFDWCVQRYKLSFPQVFCVPVENYVKN